MIELRLASLHLAPNAPWLVLLVLSAGIVALALWAYRFAIPPLPVPVRRLLAGLKLAALLALVWLLAQPVWERALGRGESRIAVLLDRSFSMDLPVTAGRAQRRSEVAEQSAEELRRRLGGRSRVQVVPFAGRLATDSTWMRTRSITALGDALAALQGAPEAQELGGVIVVSDGAVNAGQDPVAAARLLGVPVHALVVGRPGQPDRVVTEVQASAHARVGESTPVRVRIESREARGTSFRVRLMDEGRELARTQVVAPGGGAEVVAEFRVVPPRPGLAVWTAEVDSTAGELDAINNRRKVAVEVSPGKLGVLVVAGGLNWDLAFVRRALLGDSSLSLTSWVREQGEWREMESSRRGGPPQPASLAGRSVVILDGISPAEIGADFDRALASFVRRGGGLLLLGGPTPGLLRYASRELGPALALTPGGAPPQRGGVPLPTADARELLPWDDDAARGERAWRSAAPLSDVADLAPGAGDRVIVRVAGSPTPLLFARPVGRGQALMVNGTGMWRWSLAGNDELAAERARRLGRVAVRWLAEPVQGEPLRVRPERWLSARGEAVRLLASLQDDAFRPVPGAQIAGELRGAGGRPAQVAFTPGASGSYVANLEGLAPGRYALQARATKGGREPGRASTEVVVDSWSLEQALSEPDSAGLPALASATGGRVGGGAALADWARSSAGFARERHDSLRLWESPWVFAFVIGALAVEWAWRRRRGLP